MGYNGLGFAGQLNDSRLYPLGKKNTRDSIGCPMLLCVGDSRILVPPFSPAATHAHQRLPVLTGQTKS